MRMNQAVTALLFLLPASLSAAPYTQDEINLLRKISSASRQTEYSGTFVYQSGSYMETSRITHVRAGEDEYERLEGLDGERSEIIRKNNQVWCYLGANKTMVAKREGVRTFPALLPEQFTLLQDNYRISHSEEERVAGLQAFSLVFQPRDKMRFAHKIWAHQDSGLLLKALVLDEHDSILNQYIFTQLDIGGNIDRKWIRAEKVSAEKNRPAENMDEAGSIPKPVMSESGWAVQALPPGFRKITEVSRYLHGNEYPVVHLVYSDGLAGISVFIEKNGQHANAKYGLLNKGVTQIYTRMMDGYLLTVVGEVPSRTVMQVAESVRFTGRRK